MGIESWLSISPHPADFLGLMRSELCRIYMKVKELHDDDLYTVLLLVGKEALFATKLDIHEKK